MKQITQEEFQNLEKLISELESFPDSIRIFKDMHKFCLDILKNKGKKIVLWMEYKTILKKKRVAMCYSKAQDKDSIYINYTT